jgi:hypothetical protein
MSTLLMWRSQLQDKSTPLTVQAFAKSSVIRVIEDSRKLANRYVVPRNHRGDVVNEKNTGTSDMLKLHREMQVSMKQDNRMVPESARQQYDHEVGEGVRPPLSLNTVRTEENAMGASVDVVTAVPVVENSSSKAAADGEPTSGEQIQLKLRVAPVAPFRTHMAESEMYFSLWSDTMQKFVTEEFVVKLNASGVPDEINLFDRLCTVFTDLDRDKIKSQKLSLVCKVYRIGGSLKGGAEQPGKKDKDGAQGRNSRLASIMGNNNQAASSLSVLLQATRRRPVAVAVRPLSGVFDNIEDLHLEFAANGEEVEPKSIKLYQTKENKENMYATLHSQMLANKFSSQPNENYEVMPQSQGMTVYLTVFNGNKAELFAEDGALHDVPITRKVEFNDVIDPSVDRNDLYVTLKSGKFLQDGKKSQKNVLCTVSLLRNDGHELSKMIRGTGEQNQERSMYSTTVMYHNNQPVWDETFCVRLPPNPEECHLLFLYRHCSTSAKTNDKDSAPFSFSWLPLTTDKGVLLADQNELQLQSYQMVPGVMDPMVPTTERKGGKNGGIHFKNLPYISTPPPVAVTGQQSGAQPASKLKNRAFNIFGMQSDVEFIKISTHLTSTKRTQHNDLHLFLQSKAEKSIANKVQMADLRQRLSKVSYIDDRELVKFLKELFDILFTFMSQKTITKDFQLDVFTLLVHMLKIPKNNKFKSFQSMLDNYIESDHYKGSNVYETLLSCIRHHLEGCINIKKGTAITTSGRQSLNDIISSFGILMKLVVYGRRLGGDADAAFQKSISDLMKCVDGVMLKNEITLKTVQGKIVQAISSVFEHLGGVFDPSAIGTMANSFLRALYVRENDKDDNRTSLTMTLGSDQKKLKMICSLIEGPVFESRGGRDNVTPFIVELLKGYLTELIDINFEEKRSDMVTLSIDALNALFGVVQADGADAGEVKLLSVLLPEIIQSVISLQQINRRTTGKREAHLQDYTTLLLGLLHMMEPDQFEATATSQPNTESFISDLILACENMLKYELYPDEWLVLKMFEFSTLEAILRWIGNLLPEATKGAKPAPKAAEEGDDDDDEDEDDEEVHLYNEFFRLGIALLNEDTLTLENETINARQEMVIKDGDIREKVIETLRGSWDDLELNSFVGQLLGLTQSPCGFVSKFGTDLYFELLRREYDPKKVFQSVERQTIDAVDSLVTKQTQEASMADKKHKNRALARDREHGGSAKDTVEESDEKVDKFVKLFTKDLVMMFKEKEIVSERGPVDQAKALEFLSETQQLYEFLSNMAKYPDQPEYEVERTFSCHKLMAYLKKTNRDDLYQKYAHTLSDMHNKLNNFVEAGKSLMLHAELLRWIDDEDAVDFDGKYEGREKEKLYKSAIELFDKDGEWEEAIVLSQKLVNEYYRPMYKYEEVSVQLRQEANFYTKINQEDRYYPNHFCVGFFGQKFPVEYRNHQYVYRGERLESMIDFMDRIRQKFPGCKTVPPSKTITEEQMNSVDELFIQPVIVRPGTHDSKVDGKIDANKLGKYIDGKMPARLHKHLESNDINSFVYKLAFSKRKLEGMPKSQNEFLDLWVKVKYLTTETAFPSTRRRAEVIRVDDVALNPLENAVSEMFMKNMELKQFIQLVEVTPGEADQSFTMLVNGVVDAAVNGGVKNYTSFVTGDFKTENPEIWKDIQEFPHKANLIDDLRVCLTDQMELLANGIEVHGRKCAEQMRPLHAVMLPKFEILRKDITDLLGKASA